LTSVKRLTLAVLLLFMPLLMGQNYGSGIAMVNQQPAGAASAWTLISETACTGTTGTDLDGFESFTEIKSTSGNHPTIQSNVCNCVKGTSSECHLLEWTDAASSADVAVSFKWNDFDAAVGNDIAFGFRLNTTTKTGYTATVDPDGGDPVICTTDWDTTGFCVTAQHSGACDTGAMPVWGVGDYGGVVVTGTGSAVKFEWYDLGTSKPTTGPDTWSGLDCVVSPAPSVEYDDADGTFAVRMRSADVAGNDTEIDDIMFWTK